MDNAGVGVKSIDDGMVTAVSLVVTELLQVRGRGRGGRRGRRGHQHEVLGRRRAVITVSRHDVLLYLVVSCWS